MRSTDFSAAFAGLAAALIALAGRAAGLPPLETVPVRSAGAQQVYLAEGVVEAIRRSELAVQVAGQLIALPVKPGDRVKAGQLLARVDARAAEQGAAASGAQAEAAWALLKVAGKEYARQRQLFDRHYISQAALDQAEAGFKAARAQADAQRASAGAARTQSGFFSIVAPYDGRVADVPANLGDMAMPGRPLVSLYDPAALRVTASVPQARIAAVAERQPVRLEFPGMPAGEAWQTASRLTILPTADASTHTVQIRADLPGPAGHLTPGAFARVWLPMRTDGPARLYLPSSAVFRRAEMRLVYVVDGQGRPGLRQVKTGRVVGAETEILAGLSSTERVAADPLAAAAR
ncbi:efflux RND transporter periplasmic adaptor subunit [Chitinimonas koreensis]|uniref:efflux RND transporter periplasmic adaptor subunit n=1 Tax=Chitinimonas koreensis TaxID=356302 RepID=UPI00041FE54D|nr:efflux RND transporter periplasmic adaptor subunit [Chitinimonas koreensis]QNM97887.1 efflux RND transporter periplasmic adaptor subunit [Chitinimonas koreensis]